MSPLEMLTASNDMPSGLAKPTKKTALPGGLTPREVDVLRLVAQGFTDAQVAEQLVISTRTVTTHLTSIYNKLNINSRAAATYFAVKHHLV
jgi:DNA-binding NarL/FixJ family response regulator